jgi:hypothetical protein
VDRNPNFHVDADLDPDPDWHQNDAIPPSFTHVGKSLKNIYILVTALPVYNVLSFSSASSISIFWSKSLVYQLFICLDLIPTRIGRIRISMPWMPIPIQIRQNGANPPDPDPGPQHYFSLFEGHVCPPGFGSGSSRPKPTRIHPDLDPQH